jgi:hypothetical protein
MAFEADAREFFKKLLPFPDESAAIIWETLKKEGFYDDEKKKWAKVTTEKEQAADPSAVPAANDSSSSNKRRIDEVDPEEQPPEPSRKKDQRELRLYDPFVNIANRITEIAAQSGQGNNPLRGKWIATYKRVPQSDNPHRQPLLKPDISFVSLEEAQEIEEWDEIPDESMEAAPVSS